MNANHHDHHAVILQYQQFKASFFSNHGNPRSPPNAAGEILFSPFNDRHLPLPKARDLRCVTAFATSRCLAWTPSLVPGALDVGYGKDIAWVDWASLLHQGQDHLLRRSKELTIAAFKNLELHRLPLNWPNCGCGNVARFDLAGNDSKIPGQVYRTCFSFPVSRCGVFAVIPPAAVNHYDPQPSGPRHPSFSTPPAKRKRTDPQSSSRQASPSPDPLLPRPKCLVCTIQYKTTWAHHNKTCKGPVESRLEIERMVEGFVLSLRI
ncbi:hypothetical protein BDY24DRAFT_405469 [Mrakia frigida]|uniref:uncharacterized protein n=1 Tax=Mrakia frigida TaxID=29902 RepID=UPI003FCC23C9